ncbi:MAG TPA: 2-C-methyl-D-erythritol 2,4-cyclodiphosphate synthase, partial [Nitrospirales bacterium]|nr:2-C-methyl-D-erythritol 2,4-cyclodiphosphate synthase [Nitrospirales bacterium]
MRIGQGYDIHPLREGRPLILGGVVIPHSQGLDGHSDADALTHAVCDAILGAMGEGDLGTRYPSSNPEYKNLSSLVMLRSVAQTLRDKG